MNHVKHLVKGGTECRLAGAVRPQGPPTGSHTVPEEPAARKAWAHEIPRLLADRRSLLHGRTVWLKFHILCWDLSGHFIQKYILCCEPWRALWSPQEYDLLICAGTRCLSSLPALEPCVSGAVRCSTALNSRLSLGHSAAVKDKCLPLFWGQMKGWVDRYEDTKLRNGSVYYRKTVSTHPSYVRVTKAVLP